MKKLFKLLNDLDEKTMEPTPLGVAICVISSFVLFGGMVWLSL